MTDCNPLLPQPIRAKYPSQYHDMEEALLERNLVLHDGYWYNAKWNKKGEYDAYPFHPSTQVMEFEAKRKGHNLKHEVTLPIPISSWTAIKNNADANRHYNMLVQKQKYGRPLDPFIIHMIKNEPTAEMFGHSLQATGSYSEARIHWVEAGKENEFLELAQEKNIPKGWVKDVSIDRLRHQGLSERP
ncbi:TPA: hypothetical protein ACVO4Y_002470 [Vibrio diabolicus]